MPMPTKYNDEVFNAILDRIMDGESLSQITRNGRDASIPCRAAFNKWISKDKDLAELYGLAMDIRADQLFDEIIEIADDVADKESTETIQRDKLRIDSRKWVASRMRPLKYGDQTQRTTEQDDSGNVHRKTTEYGTDD